MKRSVALAFRLLLLISMLVIINGCGKKAAPVARTPEPVPARDERPAPAAAPTIQLSVSPTSVERGRQSTLTWSSTGASSVIIDGGVGNVAESGSIEITPRESTTYTAMASGPGGEARASARVTVLEPPPGEVRSADIDSLEEAIRQGKVRPVFFDYDKSTLTESAREILAENARWFRQFSSVQVIIEGHCDERGTEEYNLALGDRRAVAARDYLVQLGVDPGQLGTVSYGEERPFESGQNEAAWAQNRRAHFVVRR
ncbi:MAG: peptidoglycan-associated lipoprotein Pal [Acidobacteria bacterium]|nr:peptidoglycan-associated lipoprotein Pal [Acidobacteriota bacterium]